MFLPLFGGTQLSDQIKTFFFALEHHVLLGTASEESLKQDNRTVLLVFQFPQFIVFREFTLSFWNLVDRSLGCVSSESQFLFLVLLISLLFSALLVSSLLDEGVSLLQSSLMISILPRELLAELETHTIHTDLSVEHFGFLDGEDVVKLFQALVGRESLGLHLVLVSLLIEREAITSDWSVDC